MALKTTLFRLSELTETPCITISLNTHRTHPDNRQDKVLLKNLCAEAEERLLAEFGKNKAGNLAEKIRQIPEEIDVNYNLDSLHIFISDNLTEIVRLPWPTASDIVHIADRFAVKPIIKALNRNEEYYILALSQSGGFLYEALGDGVEAEVTTDGFPFPENEHSVENNKVKSDGKRVDNMLKEYLNKVDKALLKLHHDTNLPVVVVSTPENYTALLEVADKPSMYAGNANKDYQNTKPHQLAEQAWQVVRTLQKQKKDEALNEMKESVPTGKVITDLQEIYRAAIDGRGDLLIVHNDFQQAVKMKDARSFELVTDSKGEGVLEDITNDIAWNVVNNGGRTVFTSAEDVKDLGEIVLKTRY